MAAILDSNAVGKANLLRIHSDQDLIRKGEPEDELSKIEARGQSTLSTVNHILPLMN